MGLQEDIDALLAPADQLRYGPKYDPDPISRLLSRTGQLSPVVANRLEAQQGTYLNGVDGMMNENVVERVEHQEIYDAEDQDDVLGSGIFDPPGRPGTANTNMGSLASRYGLPGYIAREVPFTTSQDVTDLTDNASVVVVPGGGMAYVEAYGKLVGPASLGPQPAPPGIRPSGRTTTRFQPYAFLAQGSTTGWDAESLLNRVEKPLDAPAPTVSFSPLQPEAPRAPRLLPKEVNDLALGPQPLDVPPPNLPAFPFTPGSPSMYRPFPPAHPARRAPFAVQRVPGRPSYSRVPQYPGSRVVPARSYVTPTGARIGVGAAEADKTTGWAAYAIAGVVAGVALKMLHGVVSK